MMSLYLVQYFLLWNLVMNYAILALWFVLFVYGHDWLYRWHSTLFRVSPERFDAMHYMGMTVYKIAILVFNLAPFMALFLLRL